VVTTEKKFLSALGSSLWVGVVATCSFVGCAASESTAPEPRAAPPRPAASMAATEPDAPASEATSDDEASVAGMQQGFRECYQIGLWNNPHQSGSVRLVLKLDTRGKPATVTPVGGAGLDRMVVDCLVRVARRGSFAPSGGASIVVPISFRSDREREASTQRNTEHSRR
jgi:hypothetical protein